MADALEDSDNPQTSRLVAMLAGSPLLVVGATFAIGLVGTVILAVFAPGMDVAGVVTTLATLWGLDLALVIYLLTARDTDKLLDHIDALQDQLSAALEAPGPDAEVLEARPEAPQLDSVLQEPRPTATGRADPQTPSPTPVQTPEPPAGPTGAPPEPTPTPPVPEPTPTSPPPAVTPTPPTPEPPPSLTDRIPADYLAALRRQTGRDTADIERAWTPYPNGEGPWVVEDASGERWSIFQARGGRPSVIPLGSREQTRRRREERMQRSQAQRERAAADRAAAHAARTSGGATTPPGTQVSRRTGRHNPRQPSSGRPTGPSGQPPEDPSRSS